MLSILDVASCSHSPHLQSFSLCLADTHSSPRRIAHPDSIYTRTRARTLKHTQLSARLVLALHSLVRLQHCSLLMDFHAPIPGNE